MRVDDGCATLEGVANSDMMDLKKATETLIVFADLDLLVDRVVALVTAHETLRRDRISVVNDDDWIEIYRLLTDLHEVAHDGVDPALIAPAILRLRLKLTVLEVMIGTYLDMPSSKLLH